jgi:hypothetical protein
MFGLLSRLRVKTVHIHNASGYYACFIQKICVIWYMSLYFPYKNEEEYNQHVLGYCK